jgi:hypothetical protein
LICGVYKVFVATVAYVIFDSKGGQRSFTAPGMNWQSADEAGVRCSSTNVGFQFSGQVVL